MTKMTRDSENQHQPKGQLGPFAPKGGGVAIAVWLKGDELGAWSSMKELRKKAMDYAERHLIGKKFSNEATGHEIQVPKSGIKHTIAGSSDALVRTVPAIPSLIRMATLTASGPDKDGDPNIRAVEIYTAALQIDGEQHQTVMTVKLYRDGRRYYDHGLVK